MDKTTEHMMARRRKCPKEVETRVKPSMLVFLNHVKRHLIF